MKNSVFHIEPEGSRFDDLVKPKAGVKTTVKHEFQIFTRAFSNKPISRSSGEQKSFLAAKEGVLTRSPPQDFPGMSARPQHTNERIPARSSGFHEPSVGCES